LSAHELSPAAVAREPIRRAAPGNLAHRRDNSQGVVASASSLAGPQLAYVLRIRHKGGAAQDVVIAAPRTVIGSADADLVLDDRGVSPAHAEIVFKDGLVGVRDLDSETGTWCGGRRVPRVVLRPGRGFRIERTTFELVEVRELAVDEEATRIAGDPFAPPDDPDASDPEETSVRAAPSLRTDDRVLSVRGGFAGAEATKAGVIAPRVVAPIVTTARAVERAPARIDDPERSLAGAAPVLLVGVTSTRLAWLRTTLAGLSCLDTPSGRQAIARLATLPRAVVVVGAAVADMTAAALVAGLLQPSWRGRVVVIAADESVPDRDGVYYRFPAGIAADDVRRVVVSAATTRETVALAPATDTAALSSKLVFDVCAAVGSRTDSASVTEAIEDGIARLVPVTRAACMLFDAGSGVVWRTTADDDVEHPATRGLVGFVARTGRAVHVPCVGSDARYAREIDDPFGNGHEALLAIPAIGRDAEVHAVLVAVRERTQGWFDQHACDVLMRLAGELGPVLHRVTVANEAIAHLRNSAKPAVANLFRQEALAAHRERNDMGDVIRVSPAWTRAMYGSLVAMLGLGLLAAAVGEVTQYSTGPAVIRQHGRSDVAAAAAGAIASIDVEPGETVREDQILVRLGDIAERADYESTRDDFHAQLRNRLLDPTDEAAAQQLRALQRQLEAAEAALESRVIRAPHDGVVTDIGVAKGQHVAPGDAVMAVVDPKVGGLELVAFLPGGDRPQIEPGMSMRLELQGFDYAWQEVVVDSISDAVIGPNEAKRILGPQLADTLPIGGGVVMVRATLPSPTFESDGEIYPYHDGMGGVAEVRLRDETILEMLVPALKEM
jgi:membrane fusion protein (multidrug efflux system)